MYFLMAMSLHLSPSSTKERFFSLLIALVYFSLTTSRDALEVRLVVVEEDVVPLGIVDDDDEDPSLRTSKGTSELSLFPPPLLAALALLSTIRGGSVIIIIISGSKASRHWLDCLFLACYFGGVIE